MTSGITGISPIGFNLGTSAYGDYTNFMPYSMGMAGTGYGTGYGTYGAGSIFGYGPYAMGGLMEYQMYMNQLNNQIELNNLNHTRMMHAGMINNEVQAHEDSLSGLAQKVLADATVKQGIYNLNAKIKEHDQNGICDEYDKLQAYVFATFGKEIESKGTVIGRSNQVNELIEIIYSRMLGIGLRDDINLNCDSAFQNGLVMGFRGQNGRRFKDETINHIYGRRIDDVKSKHNQQRVGKVIGTAGSFVRDIGVGGAVGAGLYGTGLGAAAILTKLGGGHPINNWNWKFLGKGFGIAALAGFAIMATMDVLKRTNSSSQS